MKISCTRCHIRYRFDCFLPGFHSRRCMYPQLSRNAVQMDSSCTEQSGASRYSSAPVPRLAELTMQVRLSISLQESCRDLERRCRFGIFARFCTPTRHCELCSAPLQLWSHKLKINPAPDQGSEIRYADAHQRSMHFSLADGAWGKENSLINFLPEFNGPRYSRAETLLECCVIHCEKQGKAAQSCSASPSNGMGQTTNTFSRTWTTARRGLTERPPSSREHRMRSLTIA